MKTGSLLLLMLFAPILEAQTINLPQGFNCGIQTTATVGCLNLPVASDATLSFIDKLSTVPGESVTFYGSLSSMNPTAVDSTTVTSAGTSKSYTVAFQGAGYSAVLAYTVNLVKQGGRYAQGYNAYISQGTLTIKW